VAKKEFYARKCGTEENLSNRNGGIEENQIVVAALRKV
jgi:hypothetical protein